MNDEPNNLSGTSNDTGLFFSNITISSVVVGLLVVVVIDFVTPFDPDGDNELGYKRNVF